MNPLATPTSPDTGSGETVPAAVLNPTPLQPHQAGEETAGRLKLSKNKQLMLIVPLALLMIGGFVGVAGGFFKSDTPALAEDSLAGPGLTIPAANNQPLSPDTKYGYSAGMGAQPSSLNPSQSEIASDQSAQMLTGKERAFEIGTNESVSDAEYRAVSANPYEQKRQLSNDFQQQQSRAATEQRQVIRTMHEMPKSAQQVAEERREQEDRDFQRRTTERIMGNMERSQQIAQQSYGQGGNPGSGALNGAAIAPGNLSPELAELPLQMEAYYKAKALYGNGLPEPLLRLYSREIEAERAGQGGGTAGSGNTQIVNRDGGIQTNSVSRRNGFYGLNGKRHVPVSNQNRANLAIPAVIHGDADIISVSDGSTVKLRVLDDVSLLLNGEEVNFPANTLISGVCTLQGERIQISITNVRVGNYLYEASLSVFDMDGRPGVRVPDMMLKSQASQMLVQSGTGVTQMPFVSSNNGNVGQQFAGQMALQGANQLFQGARNLATQRVTRQRASIRANYRVLLKGGKYTPEPAPEPGMMSGQ